MFVTYKLLPTNNFFVIDAPPAVVKVPPFVLSVASVVFDILNPPVSYTHLRAHETN